MKKLMAITAILFVLLCVPFCQANDNFPWQGGQFQLFLTSSQPFTEGSTSGVNGSFYYFGVPASNVTSYYFYAGPYIQATPWLWLSPQLGMYSIGGVEDYTIASLWTLTNLPLSKFTLYAQIENYFRAGLDQVYTYFSLDHPLAKFYGGLHSESFDDDFTYGPHLGYSKGQLKVEAQYHCSFKDVNKGCTFRVLTGLTF